MSVMIGTSVADPRKCVVALVFVLICSAIFGAYHLRRELVPHDEGLLGQTAERILQGELPHRDFVDTYTGGLGMLNAFAFKLLGHDLLSIRIVLFLFFLAWIPALFFIALEFASIAGAVGITAIAVAWSIPQYPAAIPSWYNLFFATFGTLALLRQLHTSAAVWLWIAGLCAGMSILCKVAGLYVVAGALLYFLFREQSLSKSARRTPLYSMFVVAAAVMQSAFLFLLISKQFREETFFNFLLPGTLLSMLLIFREFERRGQAPLSSKDRFHILFSMAGPFLAAAALPVVLFWGFYITENASGALWEGLFVLPSKRLLWAAVLPKSSFGLWPLMTLFCLTAIAGFARGTRRQWALNALGIIMSFTLTASFYNFYAYQFVWNSARGVIPLLTGLIVLRLMGLPRILGVVSEGMGDRLMLVGSVTASVSLVQYPFAAPIYFCYAAPMAVLAGSALARELPALVRHSLGFFYFALAVLVLLPGSIWSLGRFYEPDRQTAQLTLSRSGGLYTTPEIAEVYERLIPLTVLRAAGHGILAGPDCPEVYFLTGLRNPTRFMYEFFEDVNLGRKQLQELAQDPSIKVLVVNTAPQFSQGHLNTWFRPLTVQFSSMEKIGPFEVWWRP